MTQIKYVVTSLPRSGTKYIASVLSKLGLSCGHEKHFTLARHGEDVPNAPFVYGDASWMVVPYIQSLPPGTVVLHQLRDPIKVLNSNFPPGGDSYFRSWDKHAGLQSDPLYGKIIPWKRFIWNHTKDWVWPNRIAEEKESPEEIERLIHWWTNWNLWIESAATRRSDLTYIRYRLEDLDGSKLQKIAFMISESVMEVEHCNSVLASVSPTLNRHRKPNDKITLNMIPSTAKQLMRKYGYDSTETAQV